MKTAMYTCKYCGQPSWVDPSDQSPPPYYCHPSDHGSEVELFYQVVDEFADEFAQLVRKHYDPIAKEYPDCDLQLLRCMLQEKTSVFSRHIWNEKFNK